MVAPTLTIPEWRALHTPDVIGSGSAANCVGEGYDAPLYEWAVRRGVIVEEDIGDKDAVWLGREMESTVLKFHARKSGLELLPVHTEQYREQYENVLTRGGMCTVEGWVEDRQPYVRSTRWPWMVAALDGCGHKLGAHRTVEGKYPGRRMLAKWFEPDTAPSASRVQVQHTLIVVGCIPAGDLVALIGHDYRCATVTLAETNVDALVTLERHFVECVEQGIEPRIDASPTALEAFRALHPDDDGRTVILPAESIELHRELVAVEAQIKTAHALVKRHDEIRARLQQLIGDATFGELPDGSACLSLKTQERAAHSVGASKFRVLRTVNKKAAKAGK